MLERSRKDNTYNAVTSGTILRSILRTTFLSVWARTWCPRDSRVEPTSLPRTWLFSRRWRGGGVAWSLTKSVPVGGGTRWSWSWSLPRKAMIEVEIGIGIGIDRFSRRMKSEG